MKPAKKILFMLCCAFLAALVAFTFSSCGKSGKTPAANDNKLKVTVTFNALKEMAQAVGGEYVTITTLVPDGMEVHDFEPMPQDMEALSKADVFIYNGFDLETWAGKAIESSGNEKLTVVDASEGAEPIKLTDVEAAGQGGIDPHLWLSPKGAQIQTRNIANAFIKADPAHVDSYAKNADAFIAELETLYSEYSEKLSTAPSKIIVTGHAAFGYLCRDFGLVQNSVEDVFSAGEPSPQKLAVLIEFARAKKVKTIFAEKMVSPAVSQTLASEIGAKVVAIYTMESAEDEKGYIERMRDNLEAIYISLME